MRLKAVRGWLSDGRVGRGLVAVYLHASCRERWGDAASADAKLQRIPLAD